MKLATVRDGDTTTVVRIDDDHDAVDLGVVDVGQLLATPDWREAATADGPHRDDRELDYAPLVLRPNKIVCVGLNYRTHIQEMGRELPLFPTLFAKFSAALIGAHDDIVLPAVSEEMDWEAELGVVIGARTRDIAPDDAHRAIAGYTVVNDITARDWQYRTLQWLQGKTFESTTPVGPHLVTSDEVNSDARGLRITCEVNGETVQDADTSDLVFGPSALVSYISTFVTLEPGDIIATGTPGGVGHARTPPRFLQEGDEVVTVIQGVGECRNPCWHKNRNRLDVEQS
ncbi:MAG: Acylpyruvate hydrolase [Actinomycetia bacterium]|nr:Acylpyruvate hydrolase [Actinomycetes bacterium]